MYRILIFFLFATFWSCQNNQGNTSESKILYEKVMVIHDEVMPKMRDIRILSKKLKKVENYTTHTEVLESIKSLDNAHESMMDWMAQFKIPSNIDHDKEIKYLKTQMISVQKMSDEVLSALKNAEIMATKYSTK
ncbi:MAG: hypothetical protein V3V00_03945 [Saprospiraceae bacterium]